MPRTGPRKMNVNLQKAVTPNRIGIMIYLTKDELEALNSASDDLDISRNEFVRDCIHKVLDRS
jgi:hypothetical protein